MEENLNVQELMDDPTHPFGKKCNICQADFDETNLMGWVGILPVSLCETCTGGMFSMVYALTSIDELEYLIESKKAERVDEE
jgi:hypothetical protein